MSGGSQNYLFSKVAQLVDGLLEDNEEVDPETVLKVKRVYQTMSKFMRSVEWTESGDMGVEQLEEAIRDFKQKVKEILGN